MRTGRREKVLAALEAAGWSIRQQGGGEYWGRHPQQPALSLAIGPGGRIRWRGRHLPGRSRPRAGDAPGIAEAIEAARLHDQNAAGQWATAGRGDTETDA